MGELQTWRWTRKEQEELAARPRTKQDAASKQTKSTKQANDGTKRTMLLPPLGNNVDSPICKPRVVESASPRSQSLSPVLIVICASRPILHPPVSSFQTGSSSTMTSSSEETACCSNHAVHSAALVLDSLVSKIHFLICRLCAHHCFVSCLSAVSPSLVKPTRPTCSTHCTECSNTTRSKFVS